MPRRKRLFSYDYPRPSVTVDILVFRLARDEAEMLVIRRKNAPFAGCLAFPGGFLDVADERGAQGETLEQAAARELEEETGMKAKRARLVPFSVFDEPDRDPRGRTITVAYYAVLREGQGRFVRAGDDAADTAWWPLSKLRRQKLAFDHNAMLRTAVAHLARSLYQDDVLRTALQRDFTAPRFADGCRLLLGRSFDPQRHKVQFQRMVRDGVLVRGKSDRSWRYAARRRT